MLIIRDTLWNNIRVDPLALRLVDAAAFQRLRYVRQLGLAYLVYPGATHTRFEHALGTYHLARITLGLLAERGELARVSEEECRIVQVAALLHDIGHYPFSHALEEIGALHHEEVAGPLILGGTVAAILGESLGPDAPGRVLGLIRGASDSPLQGLVSGPLDLDKIEYLKRDALMCGVPYGEIDVDRLLNALVMVREPGGDRDGVGVQEKGLSALESLLFAKYQMYRNVYWHHAVRAATAMYKRLVEEAIARGDIDARSLSAFDDEGLLHTLAERHRPSLLDALRERRLYKRVFECPAAELGGEMPEWIADDRTLTVRVENRLADELGLACGEVLLDFPAKTQMLGLDLPVRRRSGEVRRLTAEGIQGAINLPMLSEQLYRSARWLRVFAVRRIDAPLAELRRLLLLPADAVRARLEDTAPLLAA